MSVIPNSFNWFKNVWNIKVPPKLKTFLWKAIQGVLPTGENCSRRGINVQATCKRCGQLETTTHILFTCTYAQQVWSSYNWKHVPPDIFDPTSLSLSNFLPKAHLLTSLPPLGLSNCASPIWLLWNLWKDRNNFCFQNTSIKPQDLISKSFKEARDWQFAQELAINQNHQPQLPSQRVSKKQNSQFTFFVDAAWKEHHNSAGLGLILQSADDQPIRKFSKTIDHVSSSIQAEALAILEAIQQASRLQLHSITIASDSKETIEAITTNEHRELTGILGDIVHLSKQFEQISFTFVPRTANQTADSLAKSSLAEFLLDRALGPNNV